MFTHCQFGFLQNDLDLHALQKYFQISLCRGQRVLAYQPSLMSHHESTVMSNTHVFSELLDILRLIHASQYFT